MEEERQEVYERIPWETLEKKGGDRQWLVYAVAGAVVLGALAYSFMRNQPTAPPPMEAAVPTTVPATTTTISNIDSTPSTVASPVVVAEADLYAVDPERMIDQAIAHAEWFALEYIGVDGTEASKEVLSSLLPEGVPLPNPPEGTQVFVDWVRGRAATQTEPLSFDIEVLVRSLLSSDEGGFTRQAPQIVRVPVTIGEDGIARVSAAPSVEVAEPASSLELGLIEVPEDVAAQVADAGSVVGGVHRPDGGWDVVVMAEGLDGVRRPVTVFP